MKLTSATVRKLALPSGKPEAIEFDDDIPGFGVRMRDGGSKSYVFQYKIGAKQRRMKLGLLSAMDIGKARAEAERLHAKVCLGQDPAGETAQSKARAHQTFKPVADKFIEHKRKTLRPSGFAGVEYHLTVHGKTLYGLQLDKIRLADIATCINTVETNSGGPTRNRVRTTLSTFFSWCISEGYTTINPVMGTRRAEENPRAGAFTRRTPNDLVSLTG
jgi:hypothetical protein